MSRWSRKIPQTYVCYARHLASSTKSNGDIAEGISIPASYTAHLAPVSSSKLHCEVQDYATKKNKNQEIATETPYVVMFQQVNILSGAQTGPGRCGPRIQECWSFEHPRRDMILDSRGESSSSPGRLCSNGLCFRRSVYQFSQHPCGASVLPDSYRWDVTWTCRVL